jgi:hypothetical protein
MTTTEGFQRGVMIESELFSTMRQDADEEEEGGTMG